MKISFQLLTFIGSGSSLLRSVAATPLPSKQLTKRDDPEAIPVISKCINAGDFMLTFHDGPSDVTEKLLNKLIELKVPATFFINGNYEERCIYNYAGVIQRASTSGITLGHHTWTHAQLDANIALGTVNTELKQLDKAFKDILGVRPRLFAPPAGMIDRESRKSRNALIWLMAKDYTIVNRTIDTQEKREKSSDYAKQQFQAFVDSKQDSGISLSRDLREENVEEVIAQAVKILTDAKYKLVDAKTCLGFKPYVCNGSECTGRNKEDLPELKKEWENKDAICEEFLKA